jgi:hypothetical protein
MRPGREIDTRIAMEIFGFDVWVQNDQLFEKTSLGERPLRRYSSDTEWAMEVAKQMHIALLPIQGGEWFAFVGPANQDGWASPTAMLEFLSTGNFNDCGASVSRELPLAICEAALKATEKRQQLAQTRAEQAETQSQTETPSQAPHQSEQPQLRVVPTDSDSLH